MMKTQRSTVVGVFENRRNAEQAIQELKRLGFRDNQIGVAARDTEGWAEKYGQGEGNYAGEGAAVGAATGAGVGALLSLGMAFGVIPVIGPIIAAGPLAAALLSAAGGAVAGGIVGSLVGLGIPEEEAHFYEGEFKAGRIVVTVQAENRFDEAQAVLRRFGAYDVTNRGTEFTAPKETWTAAAGTASHAQTGGSKTVQVREEQMKVHKQPVETGEVRVHKEVHTEHKTVDVPVKKEEVIIERRPVTGQQASTCGIQAGEEIRIPVREEQVHIEKQPVVKEEVTVGKRQVQETEKVSGTIRKEEVKVEQTGTANIKCNTGTTGQKRNT